jgi:uncharacterized SAM-dependent methyltransferase
VSSATVKIHSSQFPESVRSDLLQSLRTRAVNHKFHYDSIKQTQRWLALHQIYSPSRHDADLVAIYDQSFRAAAELISSSRVHLIGLGCGGGQKDTHLLKELRAAGKELFYTPCDVSSALVLVAREAALAVVPDENCSPFVCDLASANDLAEEFHKLSPSGAARLISFFGMIPNFEPSAILPRLAELIRPGDTLLFSANLAPGSDYQRGVEKILPQYDNPHTRDWLMTFLIDLGVERTDGELRFSIENDEAGLGLKRVVARFYFHQPREIQIESNAFSFGAGDSIRLFFSYRYTPALVETRLHEHGLQVMNRWIASSEEEGVFLVTRA